ncbi:MAG TPA: LamG-like jellyroll fold domain-containing protein [Sedimentisphaerales bacterium]|nr:LamG-like jellyroll fold domain-containing protein [Sedimentisphaerales bacterium]
MCHNNKLSLMISLVLVVLLANVASAVYLRVDWAYPIANPSEPNHVIRNQRTAEPGWYPFTGGNWDLSRHDGLWAVGWGNYNPSGIEGSGVDVHATVGYEGDASLKVLGMTFMGDGQEPSGVPPDGDNQIANSFYISHRHWGDEPNDPNDPYIPPRSSRPSAGSIFMRFKGGGLVKGDYTLTTYHNCPNNIDRDKLSPDYPTNGDWYCDPNYEGHICDVIPWIKVGGDGVTQKVTPENVQIQHVTTDAGLVPAVTKFYYSGVEDVNVWICSPWGGDPRVGGAAVINAFILDGGDPNMATYPRPGSGAVNIHPAAKIIWKGGLNAAKHDVYFSSNFDDVNDGIALASDNQDANEYDPPGNLTLGTTYYWRIDEVNGAQVWPGMVWEFTIDEGKAKDPNTFLPGLNPGLPQSKTLAWKPGTFATSHDLYLGADFDDVNDANTTSPEFIGNFVMTPGNDANIYQIPDLLTLGESYYWRVDEHNSVYGDSKGNIWSFSIPNYLVIDDFESYNEADNLLTDTWSDGIRFVPPYYFEYVNGAIISLSYSQAEPAQPARNKQGLWYFYMNNGSSDTPYYSEAEREFEPPRDWTLYNIKALVLYFYGDPTSDANVPYNQMYVTLGDKTQKKVHRINYGYGAGQDMNDIREEEWHEWNLDLQDFADAGVDITDVNKIIIGFGDRDSNVPGGTGEIFFDDIRLYLSRCVPLISKPYADLSGDCIVDFADVRMLVEDWLETDRMVEITPPGPMKARYGFNETSGLIAHDSSGNSYDGTVIDGAPIWDPNGKYGGCLNFDETYGVLIPAAIFSDINEAITVSVWVNGDQYQREVTNVILQAGLNDPNHHFLVSIYTQWQDGQVEFRTGYDDDAGESWDDAELEDWAGQWNHYAFVSDTTRNFQGIYHNGKLVAEGTTTALMGGVTVAKIGTATDRVHDQYIGRLDDLQIFNYGLSESEIAYLVTGGSGPLYLPLESAVNLYDNEAPPFRAINFRDLAVIANSWLDKVYWP